MSTTLRDIARIAGVSATTVSKALHNHPKVSEARRSEIVALAERLGYRHNPALSAWMRRVRDIRHPTGREVLAYVTSKTVDETLRDPHGWAHRYYIGATTLAKRLGYKCTLFSTADHAGDWDRFFRMLHHRGVRGIAIGGGAELPPALFTDTRFIFASIDSVSPKASVDWVGTDHFAGILMAIEAAKNRGHRRIGFIRSNVSAQEHERWRAGFALYQADTPAPDRVPVMPALPWWGPDKSKLRDWIKRHRPTVIISSDINMTEYLRSAGVIIPDDVAFITLDKEGSDDAIAGVNQRMDEVGAALISLLAMKLELNETGPVNLPRSLLLQPKWVDGDSLRTHRTSD